jgi:hypothetical protein
MDEYTVAVEEFGETGEVTPSDRINPEGLENQGWTLTWSMEERDATPAKPVSASIYSNDTSGDILVDLMLLGVRRWVLCRSSFAFLRLTRDWLHPLIDLGRDDERLDGFLDDATDALRAIGDGLNRLAPVLDGAPKPATKRQAKSAQPVEKPA